MNGCITDYAESHLFLGRNIFAHYKRVKRNREMLRNRERLLKKNSENIMFYVQFFKYCFSFKHMISINREEQVCGLYFESGVHIIIVFS